MVLLKIQRARHITLSSTLFKAKQLEIGDYLEAVDVPEGMLLKSVTVVKRFTHVAPSVDDMANDVETAPHVGPAPLKR